MEAGDPLYRSPPLGIKVDRVSLRENRALPCVKMFAVRFLSGARQRASLPCVLYKAHDKENTHGKKWFVVRFFGDARQTLEVAVHFFETHGKPLSLPCVFA
jgi:hypothetical protein